MLIVFSVILLIMLCMIAYMGFCIVGLMSSISSCLGSTNKWSDYFSRMFQYCCCPVLVFCAFEVPVILNRLNCFKKSK